MKEKPNCIMNKYGKKSQMADPILVLSACNMAAPPKYPTENFNINSGLHGMQRKIDLYPYVDWASLGVNIHENKNSLKNLVKSLQRKFCKNLFSGYGYDVRAVRDR